KWTADTSSPPPPSRCAPVRIPASDPTGLIAENKLTIIGRIKNPKFQRPRAANRPLPLEMKMEILLPSEEVTEKNTALLVSPYSMRRKTAHPALGVQELQKTEYLVSLKQAEKQKNNDRRGYRRPEPQQFVAKRQNQTGRDDHHHYSVDRDSRFPPVGHVSHHLNRPLIETTTHRRQNDEIMRTPEASVSRVEDTQARESEFLPAIASRDRAMKEFLLGSDSLEEEVIENEPETVEPLAAPLPPIPVRSRLSASQCLGVTSASSSKNKAKSTTVAALSKKTGKRKVSKTSKRVLRNPLQVLSLPKSNEPRLKNPPRRRL
ncbi:hypothetical protein HID58_049064, partial [Brassica napus]